MATPIKFWEMHSSQASMEKMFLDSHAKEIESVEKPELLSFLPNFDGKRILELGAGIGRFTGEFASKAKHVTAVEFMAKYLEVNKETNARYSNIDFLCCDVTKLHLENSYDFVFTNWLLTYLTDEEISTLLRKAVRWLPEGGHLFFRESCFFQSGDAKLGSDDPSKYRHPLSYHSFIDSAVVKEEAVGKWSSLQLVWSRSLQAYIKFKSSPNQVCWLCEKVTTDYPPNGASEALTTQQYLYKRQSAVNTILQYEKIFGKGYVSPGGAKVTEQLVATLDLKPGERVMDIGCRIGGADFHMADKYDVSVLGVSQSSTMTSIAMEHGLKRHKHLQTKVQFEVCDVMAREFPDSSFDVIYSREAIVHIENKAVLFKKFHKWLKPGGRLLIGDYCCGPQPWPSDFKAYVAKRGFHLLEPVHYGKALENAGFDDVTADDRTALFIESLKEEIASSEKEMKKNGEDVTVIDGLKMCQQGYQKWGLFTAVKESHH
ncbi:uncharacterized protein [Oscarella lobularis]|uniref:uncharacterized protein n=1 Tax=Oscarella lobularis TaxID=121494 RepID=UPI00331441BF